jgi:hypothetical protein
VLPALKALQRKSGILSASPDIWADLILVTSYISQLRGGVYPKVLRNLIYGAMLINLPILMLTYAVLPRESIMSGANILSLVGQHSAGPWLRKIVVVDSAIVVGNENRASIQDCRHLLIMVSCVRQLCGGVLVSG